MCRIQRLRTSQLRSNVGLMCGRYALNKDLDELIQVFVARGGDARDWEPAYSVPPRTRAPIVRERLHEGEVLRNLDLATWGLRPSWAKDGGPAPINARIETAATNGMFRSAFAGARALVPMTGYYEWEAVPDGKQPHFIHAGDELLAAAGLYAPRKDPATGEWTLSFTVITREARDASGEVHDRMPVFLERDVWDEWLHPEKLEDPRAMVAMIDASSQAIAATMTTHLVSRAVNNVRTADPTDPQLVRQISG